MYRCTVIQQSESTGLQTTYLLTAGRLSPAQTCLEKDCEIIYAARPRLNLQSMQFDHPGSYYNSSSRWMVGTSSERVVGSRIYIKE